VTLTEGVAFATFTLDEVPVELPYVAELEVSGVKVAVNVSAPAAMDPGGMLIDVEATLTTVAAEAYPPPVSVMVPVGTGAPLSTVKETVAVNCCVVVMLNDDGVTATVGSALPMVRLPVDPVELL